MPVQIYLPGQTTPQIAFYNFTTGGSGNALQPDFVQTVSGPSVFLNTGREFYAGFNYFFDPVNGFVGYQWNQQVPSQYGFVMPIVALQGNVTLPASLSSTFPTYLMSNTTLSSPGTVVFQGNLFGPGWPHGRVRRHLPGGTQQHLPGRHDGEWRQPVARPRRHPALRQLAHDERRHLQPQR